MSVPCEEIRPELEALLAALPEGKLDPAGRRRLAEILRDHPDARQFYLDYCQMHALLQSAHGVLQAMEPPSAVRRRMPWIAAAAALLLMAGGAYVLRPAPRIDATVALVEGTGWIVRNGERIPLGPAMREGDRLVTAPGSRTDVRMKDGSRITLLEQTDARIGSRLQLQEGTLRCDVAPQIRPLVFETPNAEATVLGTDFDLTASWKETRLRTRSGLVRLSSGGRTADVKAGQIGVADAQGIVTWESVCDIDFTRLKELPSSFTTGFCPSDLLHTAGRKIEPAPDRVKLSEKGLTLGRPGSPNGLIDLQWTGQTGEDLIIEVDVAGGSRWGLGLCVSGTAFEGYRVFYAAIDPYPNGIAVDTIYPDACLMLARDPRPISYDKDHTLRVERRGARIRAWVDGHLRIDTEVTHPLGEGRRRTFSLCNFGAWPVLRSLRVWKAAP
jgi:ferric-dicitrate binding protein FerR (iron transport regulator)